MGRELRDERTEDTEGRGDEGAARSKKQSELDVKLRFDIFS